jgi:UDP-GlcNAc:undecaprenyl-phosphate GlcNAc-1-phosphate transferase
VAVLAGGLLALVLTLVLMPPAWLALRRLGALDIPSPRSSHEEPTPRGCGIAPWVAVLAIASLSTGLEGGARLGLVLAASAFAVIGLADDLLGLSPLVRLVAQLPAAAVGLPSVLLALPGPVAGKLLLVAGVLVWWVAFVNAYNFMDGINGMAVAQAAVAGVVRSLVGVSQGSNALAAGGAVVAGAVLGFAPFNVPRARVFLGDTGSYFLGAWLAGLVVLGLRAGIPPEAMVGPVALTLADTGTTLVRRILRGEVWYLAHRQHVYQRLVQLGWSHARTSLMAAALMLICSGLGAVSLTGSAPLRALAASALALVLTGYVTLPSLLQRSGPRVST